MDNQIEASARSRTILVVDDSEDVRELCAAYLRSEGYDVAIAVNGQEAVDLAARVQPSLILMDLSLPVMGGLKATQQIKSDPKTRHIPIVLLTAFGRKGSAAVIEAACDGFLMKPAEPKEIVLEIERVLKRSDRGGRR
jgi:CheY-like chemotaxis protein